MNPPAELASGRLALLRRARPAAWPRGWAGIAALGLTSLIGALFAARIGGDGTSLWFYDVPKVFYPNAVFWNEAARAGGIPLWIDRLGLGFPIYAEGQIGSFYLPNLLLGLLPPVTAMDVGRVLHLVVAGAGTGLIVRRLGGTWAGACVAALGAVLGGGIVGKLEWTSLVAAYAWAPWVFLPLVGRHEVSRLGLVGAGVAWGIQGLAAHPNTWVLTGICAAVLLLASDPRAASLRRLAIFGALGLAVSAVQLLPSLVLWSLSTRTTGLPAWDLFSNSATPLDVLLPGFSHAFVRSLPGEWDFAQQWYPGGLWGLHEANVYLGLPMLALVGLGAMARRSRPFLIVALVMVGIAVVGAFEPAFWLQTPILNGLRHPVRAYMLAGLMASIVAGIGVSRATLPRVSLWPAIALVGGSILAYLVLLALVVDLPDLFRAFAQSFLVLGPDTPEHFRAKAEPALTAPDPVLFEFAFGVATLGLLAIAPWIARGRLDLRRFAGRIDLRGLTLDRRAVRLALVGLVALPLIAYSPAANAQKPFDQISHAGTPYMRTVMSFEPRRFLALIDPHWYDGIPNQLASAGFTELGMWTSLNFAATDDLVKAIRFPEVGPTDATLARAAGVDVMATFDGAPCPGTGTLSPNDGPTSVCRLEAAPRPPYWIPLDAVGEPIEPPPAPLLARLLAPFGNRPVDRLVDADRAVAEAVSATVQRWDDRGAEITVEAPADGWVYLDRAWWPGWHVTVGGEPVVPDRGLGGQLVRVSAGTTVIEQALVPTEALLGLVVGIAAIVAALAWALPWRRAAAVRRRSWRGGLPAPKPKADPDPEPEAESDHEPDREAPDAGPDEPRTNRLWDRLPWTISFRSLSPVRLAIAGAILALDLLVVAWLIPVTAIVIAWPFLFAIPGWWLVSRVAPTLSPPGRLGLAVVTSVFVSAHLVNVISLMAGFGRFSVLVAVGLLALATAVLATQRLPWLAPPPPLPSANGIRAALRAYSPAFAVAGAVSLVVLLILALNGWHQTPQGWISGGWNWSDLLVHVSIGSSIVHGNFPPEVPYFAGVPLTYHWFADFHGAIGASVAGVDIIGVYFLTSALFAGMLALLVWELARQLTGNRRVATIATILVCFGGGMGWLRLGADILAGDSDVVGLITRNPYDNSWADGWPWFRIPSVLGTGFLPHRASTLGFPGFVGAILLVVTCLGRRPAGVLLAGVLAALLAPFQFYAFPATYLVVLLYVIATRAWRAPTFRRDAVLFLAPIVLALPFIAGAIFQQGERGAFHPVAIWSEARPNEGPIALLFFYVTNLGVPFLLALGAIGLAAWRRRFTPTLLFLAAWLGALFIVPNVVVVSAVEFDMNKYFQMMWFAVAILAAWLIRDWRPRAIVAVLAVAAISPALIAVWHSTNPALVLTLAGEQAGRWIERNTPERAVFVTDAFINSPVDIAGRLRLTTFGPYAANLGYDPSERERDIKVIYCAGPDVAAELMVRHGAGYVLSSGGLLICEGGGPPTDFRSSARFETVYDQNGVAVFRLVEP